MTIEHDEFSLEMDQVSTSPFTPCRQLFMAGDRKGRGRQRKRDHAQVADAAAVVDDARNTTVEAVLQALPSITPDEVQIVFDDIAAELEQRCKALSEEAAKQIVSLQMAFQVELMKLPKDVRKMELREFRDRFGEDVKAVMKFAVEDDTSNEDFVQMNVAPGGTAIKGPAQNSKRSQRSRTRGNTGGSSSGSISTASSAKSVAQTPLQNMRTRAGRTTVKKDTRAAGVPQTPSAKFDPRLPSTPSIRAPRQGESIVSVNGSPIALDGVARATFIGPAPSVTIELPGQGGIDLSAPGVMDSMADELKKDATSKLEALESEIKTLLQQLKKPCN